jgi:nucleoside-diphosphate-sugar epimerase
MNKDSKILILGHKGLVGYSVLEKLQKENYTNISVPKERIDLTNQLDTLAYINAVRPEYLFLCAAKVGGIHANNTYRAEFIYQNIMIEANVIHSCHMAGVEKLLYLGSSCIYPRNCPQPIKEKYLLTSELEKTNEPYAIAKIAGLKMVENYNNQYGYKWISVMPTNLYGSKCFSEDTDILTIDGIKNIKDIKIGDSVYTLNKNTLEVEIEKIVDTQKTLANEFYNFKTTNCDFRVTPEHKILFKSRIEYPFIKREAKDFKNKIGRNGSFILAKHNPIKKGKLFNFNLLKYKDEHNIIRKYDNFMKDGKHSRMKYYPTKYNLSDLCKFIGWYVSEGSIVDNMKTKYTKLDCGQIRISQNKNHNLQYYNEIDELLKSMGVNYGKDNFAFYFTSRAIKKFIRNEIGVGSVNKHIPKFIFNLPIKYRQYVFQTMMKGDGNKSGLRFTTKSDSLKNDFIHLCFTLGINLGKIYNDGCWRITIIGNTERNLAVKYKNISIDMVNEYSYCVTTENNHNIYAGRNNQFNWIGQCDNYDLETSHVLPAMLRKFHNAKKDHMTVVLWGTGLVKREFLHIDDLSDALVFLMNNYDDNMPINVGSGEDITLRDLSEKVMNVVGYTGHIAWDSEKPDGTPRKLLDVSKLTNLGWSAKIGLDEGLRMTYEQCQSIF